MQLFHQFQYSPIPEGAAACQTQVFRFFVTCYDESLNRVLQEEQMEVVLRYFNNESCMDETSYFDSAFLR